MDDFEDALNKIYPRHPTQEYVSHDEITALRARLEAVEKERDRLAEINGNLSQSHNELLVDGSNLQRRAERAEAALATARRDAWGRAAMVAEAWIARKENLISLPDTIRALANEAET